MLKSIFALIVFSIMASNLIAQDKPKIESLNLKDAIEIAIKNHPEIKKSKYSVEAAKGRYSRDISLPPLGLSISNEFIPSGSGLSNYDEKTIELSQGFDFPTLYFAKGSKANAEINAANFGLEQTTNYIKTTVKRTYYTALAKYLLLKVAEENFNIASEFLKKATIRNQVGEGSNLELLTSKVQLSESKSLIEISKKEYQTALNELNHSLGYSSEIDISNFKFLDSLPYRKFGFSQEELLNQSLQMNPLLKKAAYELESSEISQQLAWMNLIPSFNFSYMFQTRPNSPNFYGVRLGMTLPLWFMFDQKGQIQEATAITQINTYEIQNIRNNILQKINSAYIDFINDDKQLNLYQKELIPLSEEIFRTADLSYQAGEISYLEFLQAKFTTVNTRINFIKSLFDYNEALLNLEESTGITLE